MKNKPKSILTSSNYATFTVAETNREPSKVRKIKTSLEKYGWLEAYPMHVVRRDGRLVIIDGQHRFKAAQSLGIPVFYVICGDTQKINIAEINSAQTPWSPKDYVTSYARQGKSDYQYLLQFAEHHKLPLGISAKLLLGAKNRSTGTDELRSGEFKVKDSDRAAKIAALITNLRSIVKWSFNSFFVDAIDKAIRVKGFDSVQFLRRCHSFPGLLILQPTTSDFLKMIERIYNHKSANSNRLPVAFMAEN